MKTNVLYVFGGEKAQGAEIVIQRLMEYNTAAVNPHLFISPGKFADRLVEENKAYPVTCIHNLKKLNRSHTKAVNFYLSAVRNYFAVSYQVYKYIKKHNIQAVHANTIVPASYLIPLISFLRLTGKRVKFLWSDHDISYFSKVDYQLSKQCVKLYDATLVVSQAVKQKYPANDKVKVLYNGLDTRIFKADTTQRAAFRAKQQLPDDALIIGMPAVVTPRKGQLGLIQAFNQLLPQFSNIILLFAGGYEEATPEYSAQVTEAIQANRKIIHIGYADNMAAFYNGCDVIVSNSNLAGSEPLGTTIYEAMACQKIVIAANTGGSSEIIEDRADGFLFEPENIDALQQTLAYIVSHYNELNAIRAAALEKAAFKFNITVMAHQYNNILQTL